MKLIIKVGYQDSRELTLTAGEIPVYMGMLQRAFPGDWSIRPATETPVEIEPDEIPPVEEVEPADPEDYDDSIVSSFIKDSEDF